MDKQKQIEEMARIIAFDLCPNRNIHAKWGEEAQCYSDNNFSECTKIKNVVDKLYNAGCRKLDDHAIMVLRKAKGMEERIRKETAEKFAERLKEYYPLEEGFSHFHYILNEICKEIMEGKE